jgi:murein DD-endopeptidase MepM/ murein hydrolase activator NlpD
MAGKRLGRRLLILLSLTASACARNVTDVDPSFLSHRLPSPAWPEASVGLPPMAIFDAAARAEDPPEPGAGAPCGRVDRLDFPVGPPDGSGFAARWAYGRFSRRYGKIHAGEDWLRLSGPSLGEPVYAIGHGRVSYADPYGWGATDKAVLILEHLTSGGDRVYSMYGHMEPASVVLRPGACVSRGDPVGRIGKPRGQAHLHFELRDHLPSQPGPGYWASDPSEAGWHPPSEFIWQARLLSSPGLRWSRAITTEHLLLPGSIAGAGPSLIEEQRLLVLGPESGEAVFRLELDELPAQALLDEAGSTLYLQSQPGGLSAIRFQPASEGAAGPAAEEAWRVPLAAAPTPVLMPRPGGGIVFHDGRDLLARDAGGRELWRIPEAPSPAEWTRSGEGIIYTSPPTAGQAGSRSDRSLGFGQAGPGESRLVSAAAHTFRLEADGRILPLGIAWGRPTVLGDQVFVQHPEGLYRIDPALAASQGPVAATRYLMPLPKVGIEAGQLLALPELGLLLIAHGGIGDARLICLEMDGRLRWEVSTRALTDRGRPPRLIQRAGRTLMVSQIGDIFELDLQNGSALRVHDAGRGLRFAGRLSLEGGAAGDPLLLDARTGWLLALDPPPPDRKLRAE